MTTRERLEMSRSDKQLDRDRERMDDMLLKAGSSYHDEAVIGLRFVIPPEVHPEGKGEREKVPGVYLKFSHPNSSPTARLHHEERLLTPEEALEWAATVDRFAHGVRSGDGGMRHEESLYPQSYREFVGAWYAALAQRMDIAVEAAEERRSQLREVRAALTGRTG
jgi:hypothetical protein